MTPHELVVALASRLGHRLDVEVADRFRRSLKACAERLELSLDDFAANAAPGSSRWNDAVEGVLVRETSFFRDPSQFASVLALSNEAKTRGSPWTTALSVGCSTGEEAYSLAAVLLENSPHVVVTALDVSRDALETGQAGRYGARAFREVPASALGDAVEVDGESVTVRPQLRSSVRFEQANLADASPWTGEVDVVMCRNALMYFSPQHTRALQAWLPTVVRPSGCLVVGPLDLPEPPPGFVLAQSESLPSTLLGRALAQLGPSSAVYVRGPRATRVPRDAYVPAALIDVAAKVSHARALADRGAVNEAVAALEPHANDADAELLLGVLLVERGEHERAVRCFRHVLVSRPDSIEARLRLWLALSRQPSADGERRVLAAALSERVASLTDDEEIAAGLTAGWVRHAVQERA